MNKLKKAVEYFASMQKKTYNKFQILRLKRINFDKNTRISCKQK